MLHVPLAVGAGLGAAVGTVLVVEECRDSGVGDDDDVSSRSPGPTEGLAPGATARLYERGVAGAAVTGAEVDPNLVDEHGPSRAGGVSPRCGR
jgi:hypothetical protein